MKDLRERCEKLKQDLNQWRQNVQGGYPVAGSMNDILEAFAREIRNEALEEAAKIADQGERDDVEGGICSWVAQEIRTLALAIPVSKEE